VKAGGGGRRGGAARVRRAVQPTAGRGGRARTLSPRPARRPSHGGPSSPPVDRHGMPGFPRVLEAVARAFRDKPEDVARAVGQLVAGVQRSEETATAAATLDPTLSRRAAGAMVPPVDPLPGGLGGAPQVPPSPAF